MGWDSNKGEADPATVAFGLTGLLPVPSLAPYPPPAPPLPFLPPFPYRRSVDPLLKRQPLPLFPFSDPRLAHKYTCLSLVVHLIGHKEALVVEHPKPKTQRYTIPSFGLSRLNHVSLCTLLGPYPLETNKDLSPGSPLPLPFLTPMSLMNSLLTYRKVWYLSNESRSRRSRRFVFMPLMKGPNNAINLLYSYWYEIFTCRTTR